MELRHRHVLPLVLATLALAACSQAGHGEQSLGRDLLVIPGERVGNVGIGMTLEQLTASAGQPALLLDSDSTRFAYRDARISGVYVPGAGVVWIDYGRLEETPLGSAVHTPEGIHLGSGRIEVLRAYGAPPKDQAGQLDYPARGVAFTLRNDRVARISVYAPSAP